MDTGASDHPGLQESLWIYFLINSVSQWVRGHGPWRGSLEPGPAGCLNHVEWFGTDPEKLLWNFYQINDLIRNGLGSVLVLGWVVEDRKAG